MKRSTMIGVAGGMAAGAGLAVLAVTASSWAYESNGGAPGVMVPLASQSAVVEFSQAARLGETPNLADLVEAVSPSVVQIIVRSSRERDLRDQVPRSLRGLVPEPGQLPDQMGSGSGFFIDQAGHIVTNNHVVENATAVTIRFPDGREMSADVIGTDPKTDLAVLKASGGRLPTPLAWGDSEKVRPGENIFAVGSPFGLGNTVTAGIVSARGRAIGGQYDDYIQVDASINRGNSGGPLFNDRAQVIGVNSAIYSPTGASVGIGFSIPADLAKSIVDQIIENGVVERGWLGVGIQPVTPDISKSLGLENVKGALVQDVTDDSPAAKAGVQVGDVITAFGQTPIEDLFDLTRAVAATPVGTNQTISVLRDGQSRTLTANIAKLEDVPVTRVASTQRAPSTTRPSEIDLGELGLTLSTLNGVVVADVEVNSPAGDSGLRAGDKVLRIGSVSVETAQEAKQAIDRVKQSGREAVLFRVNREGRNMFVGVPFER